MDDQPRGYAPPSGERHQGAPVRDDSRPFAPAPIETQPRPGGLPPSDAPPRRPSILRRLLWLLILALIVAGIVWWVLRHQQPTGGGRFVSNGAMPVGTAAVAQGDMPVADNALGTVTPLATVTVQTQINGQLIEVGFQEGQMVKKGDFLAQIDPRPYQVALEQAQGQLAKDKAALADAELDLARYKKLAAQNAIASQTVDTQAATVAQDRGTVQVDQAQVDAQQLNLTYCRITAPVSGRVGLRQVDPGNYVQTSSTTGIVVVTQLQPISVIFTLPEDSLQAVLKQVHAGQKLKVVAFDRTGNTQLDTGELGTIDNQIDTTTGTVKMRAIFTNATLNLFPNQFVNIKLTVDTLKNVNIVPDSAIQRGAPGTFVYLVKPDSTVTAQPVTLGPDNGTKVAVLKGLEPGQMVVTDGADRLKEGGKVTVTENGAGPPNSVAPATAAPAGGHGRRQGQGQGQHERGAAPGAQTPGQPAPGGG
ncbi:MAG TPA: MdtA/MuxA family multidrug efflux RND transporter periplasmic adaptor subunit [Stellaceae bacterium]|nr:MdtA/MuxA family multidrug efflux RND transporter periplasmic adaptor subunit [Stellaceae bacterium]